jgi:S-adenosylmethionine/arginine decarboxylase-like enzyme
VFVPFHQHILVKGYCTNPPKDEEKINDWFRRLVQKVRMVVVAGPTSVYVNEPGNEGLTGTVTLATSHSSIHIWDHYDLPMFQFDLYSCSCFTVEEIIEHFQEFDIISLEWMMIDRNEGLSISKEGTWKLEEVSQN